VENDIGGNLVAWNITKERGHLSKWLNFQKMLASFRKNSIIISAEIYTRFFYVFMDIKEQNPFKAEGVR